jgi:hypothetical protein
MPRCNLDQLFTFISYYKIRWKKEGIGGRFPNTSVFNFDGGFLREINIYGAMVPVFLRHAIFKKIP